MASLKIIQNIGEFTFNGSSVSSDPIALKSGYLRIANGPQFCHVAIGSTTIATEDDFGITANESLVLKESVASQGISGITTGAQTILLSPEGGGSAHSVGDYISISGASPVGINTNWARVVSVLGRQLVLDYDTSNVIGPYSFAGAETRRSVKVTFNTSHGAAFAHVSEIQIAGS